MSTAILEPPVLSRPDAMMPRPAIVRKVTPEAYGIATFTIEFDPADGPFSFEPGQFNMLYLPGFGEVAISISSEPGERYEIDHTIRFAGNVTRAISRLSPGDMIGVRGPYGTAWPIQEALGKELLIVAGGIGLAPLKPVIHHVLENRGDFSRVMLLYGARTPADLLYTDLFDGWQKAGIDVQFTVDRADDHWKNNVGVVPLLFYRIHLNRNDTIVFTCGPEVMMRFVIYEAIARRIPKEQIWVSLERNMKCAIGLCGHCQYGPMFICKDGAVLNFPKIEPFFNREEF